MTLEAAAAWLADQEMVFESNGSRALVIDLGDYEGYLTTTELLVTEPDDIYEVWSMPWDGTTDHLRKLIDEWYWIEQEIREPWRAL